MGAIVRRFLDPEYETEITVREVPFERDGETSRRLKGWSFEGPDGDSLGVLPVHRTDHLGEPTEAELEVLYLYVLRYC